MNDRKENRTPRAGEHVERRLQSLLDGALSREESKRVLDHCASCPSCEKARAELEDMGRALEASGEMEPVRPVWPEIRRRLGRRRAPAPRYSFALGAAAAALVGVMIGAAIHPATEVSAVTWQQESWAEVGTLVTDGTGTSLADLYFAVTDDEGGET